MGEVDPALAIIYDLQKARTEIERLRKMDECNIEKVEALLREEERLRSTYGYQSAYIEQLEGALEFYADEENWEEPIWTGTRGGPRPAPAHEDAGDNARAALHTEAPSDPRASSARQESSGRDDA